MGIKKEKLWAAAGVLAAASLGGAFFQRARRVPWFPYQLPPLSETDFQALGSRPGWQARTLQVAPGIVVRGLMRRPSTEHSPWVMVLGGNSDHFLSDGQRLIDGVVAETGWGGIIWAYRGFDGSGGAPDPDTLLNDAWAEQSRLWADEHVEPRQVHLLGFSLGTSLVAGLAARAPAQPPGSITLLAPMIRLEMRGHDGTVLGHRYETWKYLASITAPALVIHGGQDTTLPPAGGKRVAAALGANARFIEYPELGHLDLPESSAVLSDVRAFIAAAAAR